MNEAVVLLYFKHNRLINLTTYLRLMVPKETSFIARARSLSSDGLASYVCKSPNSAYFDLM